MHAAIVILNFNGWQDTLACVTSLLADPLLPCPVSIVVADNASRDGSLNHLATQLPPLLPGPTLRLTRDEANAGQGAAPPTGPAQLVLIDNAANLGFAAGNNTGIRWALAAGADVVWLLNNDTEVEPGALAALVARCQADPAIGLCGSKLIYHGNRRMVQARGGSRYNPATGLGQHIGVGEPTDAPEDAQDIEQSLDYVVGASMLATRRFLLDVGLMAEDYLLYFEEIDWAMRGRRAGYRLGYAPGSVVFHKEGASIGSSHLHRGSLLSHQFKSRNRLLFTRRFHPELLGAVRRTMLFEVLVWLKRREFRLAWTLLSALLGRDYTLPA